MIGFFFKKAFFDGWDHLFSLVAMNAVHLLLFLGIIVLPQSLGVTGFASLACIALGIIAMTLWQTACSRMANDISDYGSATFASAFAALKAGLVPGLQMAGINLLLFFALGVGIPFYLSVQGFFGPFAAGLLFWTAAIILLVFQYFFPLQARFGGGFRKNARKSATLFMDNPGFSIFLLFYNAVSLVLSILLAFLVPGLAGIAVAQADAVKLRIRKYDWLDANPDANRKAVPWGELLEEERELVGERSLKGMIFPWREGK